MEVAPLLQELVRTPSVNPENPGASTPAEVLGEHRMVALLGERLRSLGADTREEAPATAPDRPNLVAEFPSDAPGKPRLLFGPHSDTVGIEGMTIDPFGGELRDDRVWGRGASDTKGTMAAMIAALARLGADEISRLPAEIHFVAFSAEETAQHGSIDFGRRHAGRYRFAVVGEPTGCSVVHTHKGCTWATLETRGHAVHGARPELGDNAIARMMRLLEVVDGPFREALAEGPEHPYLGRSTVNIGTIEGGTRTNIVPDQCRATIDLRTTPERIDPDGFDLLRKMVLEADAAAEVGLVGPPAPPLATDPGDPYVVALAEVGNGLAGAPWFCDAARLAEEGGIPAVAAGPGSIEQAHTVDEWISVADLEAGVDFYEAFLRALPTEPS